MPGGPVDRGNLGVVERRPTLSLNEWAVLGLLVDQPRHGYDIAAALRPGTPVGDAWRLSRQLVYRALARIEALGLAQADHTEPSAAGPPRTVYAPTERGRSDLRAWLVTPVDHVRDVRNALLLKLVVTEQLGLDPGELVAAQRERFAALLGNLVEQRPDPPPRSDVIALWRHHSAAAVASFLDALAAPQPRPDAGAEPDE